MLGQKYSACLEALQKSLKQNLQREMQASFFNCYWIHRDLFGVPQHKSDVINTATSMVRGATSLIKIGESMSATYDKF